MLVHPVVYQVGDSGTLLLSCFTLIQFRTWKWASTKYIFHGLYLVLSYKSLSTLSSFYGVVHYSNEYSWYIHDSWVLMFFVWTLFIPHLERHWWHFDKCKPTDCCKGEMSVIVLQGYGSWGATPMSKDGPAFIHIQQC